jgi:transcriptional regulator with XRE-family HTH domain
MKNLKSLRNGAGMSQERFGELCGISRFAVMDYEHGRGSPTVDVAKKMARVLKCTLSDLDDENPLLAPAAGAKLKEPTVKRDRRKRIAAA